MDGVPPPRFSLSLLGRFELTGPDGVVDLPSKKLAALLTYLACTVPQPQRRETLSTLLWGSHFDAQAKQNLRQALFRLRKVLGQDALAGDGEVVSLNPAVVSSDVGRFEALVREGTRDALRAAAELYRGPLVDDVAVSEEGWSEWLTAERERLLEPALGAMVGLGEQELAAGRPENALRAGQRAIALNSMREDAHRMIVRSLAAAGRKAEALKHYQDLVALLKRELNTEPDATTRSLEAELRSAQPPTVEKVAERRLDINQDTKIDAASPVVPTRSADPERRQLTIMACRIVGLPRSGNIDPEDLRDRIGAFHRTVADVAARFDGFVAQHHGDSVLVYFGYPAAHEHDAEQAVRAGLAIVDLVGTLTIGFDAPPKASAGIATGLVVIGEQVGTDRQNIAIGEAPSLAAQLQAVATPGEVVIAASTRRLVGRLFDCRARVANELNGLPQSVEAWQVRGEVAGVGRFEALRTGALSPLVGRQEEMDLLLRRWDQAKLGEGRVALLSGEPGIGKSRIAESLLEKLEGEPHTSARYFSSPHHIHSPLYPFITHLERAASFEPGSSANAKLDRLEALLKPMARNAPRDLTLIADLLSVPTEGRYPALAVSPQQKRELTLTALLDQLEGVAADGSILIVFEDVHWIDPTSLDLLDRMVSRVTDLPVLLIVTFRSEFQPTWIDQPHVTMLSLTRLGHRDSTGIIGGVTRGKALPDGVLDQVLSHADGVPLFIEELTRSLLESGILHETAESYVLDGPLPPLAIPTTLQASLAARLDRLNPVKDVAQIGAAIGREFSHELISVVSRLAPRDLDVALERLTASGLIFRRGAPPVATYLFKHALVQDAAYETLLRSRRQILHRRIADVLRGEFAAAAAAEPELVAHHLTQAGLDEPAIEWWGKAGDQALRRSAFKEAAAHLGKAIELADKLAMTGPSAAPSSSRLHLQTKLGNALIWTKGYHAPETAAAFARARELASREEDASERFSAYYGLWAGHLNRSEPAPLREIAELFLREATASPNCPEALIAHRTFGFTCWYFGDFVGAHHHFQKSIKLYDQERHGDFANRFGQDPGAGAEMCDALTLWVLGRIDEALRLADHALASAESAAHAPTMAYAAFLAAMLGLVRYNSNAVATHSQAFADIVSRYNLPGFWSGAAVFYQAWAQGADRAEDSRLAEMRRGLAIYREQGRFWLVPSLEAALAEAEAGSGETDAALRRLDDAIGELNGTESRLYEAEMHRVRAGILLKRRPADTGAAEHALQTAVAIAQSQKARSFELRAALSLAKLYHAANRLADAQTVLASAIEGFPPTEQFPDLTEAQALLSALSL
jgi:DNA-binding SARP family transcriptional activator/predicted ATPase